MIYSSILLLLHFPVFKVLLELIEAFVPEPLVRVNPYGHIAKWLASQGNEHLAAALLAVDEARAFQELQVLRHCVQCSVERLGHIEEPGRSVCELPNDRSPGGVRNGDQNVRELIHGNITP